MVETLGFAIAAAVAEGTAVSATTATIIGSTALLAVGTGVNLLAASLTDNGQKVASQQFASRQPVPPRQRSYGRVKLAGPNVQFKSVGGAFIYGLYHGEGPWDGYEQWWLDDLLTSVATNSLGGVVSTIPWRGYVAVDSHLGGTPQTPSNLLLGTPGWDLNHRLDGCAYTAVKSVAPNEKKFKAYFPKSSWPALRVVGRAARVRDTRLGQTADQSTWTWSQNSALCIRDFLTHDWGLRVPVSLINESSFAAMANLCDQPVTRKDGQVVPRYRLGGTYLLTDDPIDTLNQMLATCDATLTFEFDGTIGISGGQYVAPTFSLSADDAVSIQIESGTDKYSSFNRLKITYVEPNNDYQQVEAQSWDDLDNQVETDEILEEDFSRPWVQDFNQVRRLAKIHMSRGNPKYKITGVFKLSAAPALFEQIIQFTFDSAGINMPFQVTRSVANIENGTVTLDLESVDPGMYSFDSNTEEGTPPPTPTATAAPSPPTPPENLTVVLEKRAVNGSLNAVFLRMTATTPGGRSDLSLLGRYRVVGSADYSVMVQDTDDPLSLISQVLADGTQYEVQGALATYGQALVSDYVSALNSPILAVADSTPPGPPTGFVVNGGVGKTSYAFTAPDSPNFSYARVLRNTVNRYDTATLVKTHNGAASQAFDGTDTGLAAGSYFYWVTAYNASGYGDTSSTAGPVQATVA